MKVHMKTIGQVELLLVVVASLLGCGAQAKPSPSAAGLDLELAPWQDGDTIHYTWLDKSGAEIGTSQFSFALQEGTWIMTQTDTFDGLAQTAEVKVAADTLEPLGEQKTIQASSTNVTVTTTYQDGKVNIKADVNGKGQTATMAAPSRAIDNDQFLMTLRALPFAEGYKATYPILVTQNALKVDTAVTVQKQEQVEVPAGTFTTWPVQMTTSQGTQTAWYQVDAPHNLVQYDNGVNRMVFTQD